MIQNSVFPCLAWNGNYGAMFPWEEKQQPTGLTVPEAVAGRLLEVGRSFLVGGGIYSWPLGQADAVEKNQTSVLSPGLSGLKIW